MENTQDIYRSVMSLASEIAASAARAPDEWSKREIYACVKKLRIQYGLTFEQKRGNVVTSLKMGASSYEDIVRETCIDIASVKAVVDDLVSQGMVKREPTVSGPNGGRPVIFLSLIDIVFD